MKNAICLAAMIMILTSSASSQDWPQWRGATQDGIAPRGPTIAPAWGKAGPPKLWESNAIPTGQGGGFSSVSVAGGKAYLYVNWKSQEPIVTRKIVQEQLSALGLFSEKVPDDILAKIEADRVGEARTALKAPEVKAWVDKWVADNLDANQRKAFGRVAVERLTRGPAAISLDVLKKLTTIKDKEFESAEAMTKWLGENAIAADVAAQVMKVVPTSKPIAKDVIICLDAGNGKELWRREYGGQPFDWGSSSTPCVRDGRCYVAGGKALYCLDANSGGEIWKTPTKGEQVSSSAMVIDGVVVALGGQLMGVSAADGNVLWACKDIGGNKPSPVSWTKDGKNYILCNSNKGIACVVPATGEVLWTVPGGGSGTVAVGGDVIAVLSENKDIGLVAYRITPQKAEKLWSIPGADRGTTPIIHEGYVYAVGAGAARCISVADGNVAWEQKVACEICSPLLVDGKIIAQVENNKIWMLAATPEKFEALAKAGMGAAQCSSPVVSGGKLFLRLNNSVACYDLTASPTSEPAK